MVYAAKRNADQGSRACAPHQTEFLVLRAGQDAEV
jgi:hypothetical protein